MVVVVVVVVCVWGGGVPSRGSSVVPRAEAGLGNCRGNSPSVITQDGIRGVVLKAGNRVSIYYSTKGLYNNVGMRG